MAINFLRKSCLFFILYILPVTVIASQFSIAEDTQIIFGKSELSVISADHQYKFMVEIADTSDKRARGLMFREKMAAKDGMLFLFKANQVVNMWMKNTFIPLDIVFIDQKGVIIHIAKSTKPHSLDIISSYKPVVSVLELNAGVTDKLNIHVGDKINHPFFGH